MAARRRITTDCYCCRCIPSQNTLEKRGWVFNDIVLCSPPPPPPPRGHPEHMFQEEKKYHVPLSCRMLLLNMPPPNTILRLPRWRVNPVAYHSSMPRKKVVKNRTMFGHRALIRGTIVYRTYATRTKTIYFPFATNNVWSYSLWSPVVLSFLGWTALKNCYA